MPGHNLEKPPSGNKPKAKYPGKQKHTHLFLARMRRATRKATALNGTWIRVASGGPGNRSVLGVAVVA